MRPVTRAAVGLVALLTAVPTPTEEAVVQEQAMAVAKAGATALARVSPDGTVGDTLYRTGGASISGVTVAPSGRLIGLVETTDLATYQHRLVVLDATGRVVRVIDHDVRPYVWCCGADNIAFIAGRATEDEIGFRPAGAYLVDVRSGTETRLDVPQDVYEVIWAPFDGALYFKTTRGRPGSNILRYDPRTREVRTTSYLDMHFSPSGSHYLQYIGDPALGRHGWHIYERATGTEVPLPDQSLGSVDGWVFQEGAYLRLKRVRSSPPQGMIRGAETIEGYTIYDVDRRVVAARIQGPIRTDVVATIGTLVVPANGAMRLIRSPREVIAR